MERKPRRKFSKEFENEAVRLAEESDIAAIPTREGWLYLCVFMDLYSRTIVDWSMSGRMKGELELQGSACIRRESKLTVSRVSVKLVLLESA